MKKLKIWVISDTHCKHDLLIVPEGIDMVIHTGDCSNDRSPIINEHEVIDFISWYSTLNIKHKIFVPGNHDTSIEAGLVPKSKFTDVGIEILIDEGIIVEGVSMYGTPYTPRFGYNWAYNEDRDKMRGHLLDAHRVDILLSHGPSHGNLDLTRDDSTGRYVQTGCKATLDFIKMMKPKYHIHGHLHDEPLIINSAMKIVDETTYINASVVDYYHNIINNGKIIEI